MSSEATAVAGGPPVPTGVGELRTGRYPMLTLMVVHTGLGITVMSAG
ncbi:hypothetical protein ACIBO5_59210 [Nonomuraea angiospora]|nr:hypothetical protein [Nonomuraea angiospora]MDX3100337.1 hypothetical protein [Nonomuraea angiospora]